MLFKVQVQCICWEGGGTQYRVPEMSGARPDRTVTLKVFNVKCYVWSHLKGKMSPASVVQNRYSAINVGVFYVPVKVDRETL